MDERRLIEIENGLGSEFGYERPVDRIPDLEQACRELIAEVRRLRGEEITIQIEPGATEVVPGHGPVKNMGNETIFVKAN